VVEFRPRKVKRAPFKYKSKKEHNLTRRLGKGKGKGKKCQYRYTQALRDLTG